VLGDDLFVLTGEFGEWEDSGRRIDLLAIDPQANLVVIELKRTNDGGHVELQAIRYASMASAMTFDRAEQIHGEFLARMDRSPEEARSRILTFLGWEEPDEENFALDVHSTGFRRFREAQRF
jgi:RecB family endonuclease NucS